jgi:hypothetical protein
MERAGLEIIGKLLKKTTEKFKNCALEKRKGAAPAMWILLILDCPARQKMETNKTSTCGLGCARPFQSRP